MTFLFIHHICIYQQGNVIAVTTKTHEQRYQDKTLNIGYDPNRVPGKHIYRSQVSKDPKLPNRTFIFIFIIHTFYFLHLAPHRSPVLYGLWNKCFLRADMKQI